jgi:hypothetical protein
MKNRHCLSRRDFLFGMAATLLATHTIVYAGTDVPGPVNRLVDWEDVLNKVIGDRNELVSGFSKGPISYPVGSPEWCMEEALAGHELLAEGAQVHV